MEPEEPCGEGQKAGNEEEDENGEKRAHPARDHPGLSLLAHTFVIGLGGLDS
jgi:hypothetical protein